MDGLRPIEVRGWRRQEVGIGTRRRSFWQPNYAAAIDAECGVEK